MIHGGDIYRNKVTLDFSVNVNPLGMPTRVREALLEAVGLSERYPDPYAERLKLSLSKYLSIPSEYLLLGNGASEILLAVMHAMKPRKCVIPTPSFFGYEYAAEASGAEVIYVQMERDNEYCLNEKIFSVLDETVDLLVIANPNNPVGNLMPFPFMKKVIQHCEKRKITVLLDECFIEFCEENQSMLPYLDVYQNLIVVRAFTKIFAIPGVRLGYMVSAQKALVEKVGAHLPEWNLSVFAQAAGAACCGEADFVKQTVSYVKREGVYLEQGLKRAGLMVFNHAANFMLTYTETPLYEKLLERGILIRDCSNFRGLSKGYYRFAIKSREENEKLLQEIEK